MLYLKILGPLLTAVGSLLLAWRVKKILDSVVLAQSAAETNFFSLHAFLANKTPTLKIVGGLDQHVERSQRFGIWLLVTGFLLIGAGALVSAYAAWQAI